MKILKRQALRCERRASGGCSTSASNYTQSIPNFEKFGASSLSRLVMITITGGSFVAWWSSSDG
jgi:hypothetical protein